MKRIWNARKRFHERDVKRYSQESQNMTCLSTMDHGPEWRAVVVFNTKTLILDKAGNVTRDGPVVVGIRYHERYLSEAPHPMSLACVLEPMRIFHPNCDAGGPMCLGHPQAGISLDLILNQIWAGLMFNMKIVNTRAGEYVNFAAARYVRSHADTFPISQRGLLEEPEEDLLRGIWHVPPQQRFNKDLQEGGIDDENAE